MKVDILKSIVFTCVFLVISGCSITGDKIELEEKTNTSLHEYTYNNEEFPPNIIGTVKVNDLAYEMARGNYQWKKGNSHVQTDAVGTEQLAEKYQAIVLEPESIMTIEIEQTPQLSAILWSSNEKEGILKNNQLNAPSKKGRYIYEIVAKWSNGEASFTFVVEVK